MSSIEAMTATGPDTRPRLSVSAATTGAMAVLVVGVLALSSIEFGHVSTHMAIHISSMNVVAPLLAALLLRTKSGPASTPRLLWTVTLLQLALLWAVHMPSVHRGLMAGPILNVMAQAALFMTAAMFWYAVIGSIGSRWQAVLALLITGKLACLLGAVLIFAPRVLYAMPGAGLPHHGGSSLPPLEDQQLAGLLMVAACPLSYVLAGVIITAQALRGTGTPQLAPAASFQGR